MSTAAVPGNRAVGRGLLGWEGDLYAAVNYLPGTGNSEDPGTELVRRLKAGDPAAPGVAARLILGGLLIRESFLRRHQQSIEIVAVPGHLRGSAGIPVHRVCEALAASVPWLAIPAGQADQDESDPELADGCDAALGRGASGHACLHRAAGTVFDHHRRCVHSWPHRRGLRHRSRGQRRERRGRRLPRKNRDMRARVFLFDPETEDHRFGGEVDADSADEVWRLAETTPELVGRTLCTGDVVYIEDVYLRLDGDGGWHPIPPGEATIRLHGMIG